MTQRDRNIVEQEPEGVDVRRAVVIVLGTTVVFLAAVGVAYLLLPDATPGAPPEGEETRQERGGEVLVNSVRGRAMGLERHEEGRRHLMEHGWVDAEEGLVHVPIEAAMELYLAGDGGGSAPDGGSP